jgi:hypothetical protein
LSARDSELEREENQDRLSMTGEFRRWDFNEKAKDIHIQIIFSKFNCSFRKRRHGFGGGKGAHEKCMGDRGAKKGFINTQRPNETVDNAWYLSLY